MVRPIVPRRLVEQPGLPATVDSRSHSFGRLFPCGYFRFGFKIWVETSLAGDVAPALNDAAGSAKPRIGKHLMIAVVDVDPTAEFAGVFLPTCFHLFLGSRILFGHSKLTLLLLAAVPAALGDVLNAGKYLIAAAWRAIGQRLALARAGRHGAACRVVVGRCVEGGIGVVFATPRQRWPTWGELAATIARKHDREDRVVHLGIALVMIRHWRIA